MRRPPWIVWAGLAVVLAAAAVLSFDALRGLALAVSIPGHFAWLLPIAVDAGAAVSSAVWLGNRAGEDAARFAGRMTWSLLAVTVLGNAGALGMHAHGVTPPWWVAVLVGTIPPVVVGCSVHLVVLLVRRPAVVPSHRQDGTAPDHPDRLTLTPGPAEADTADHQTAVDGPGPDPRTPDPLTTDPDQELVARLTAWADREGAVPSRERVRQEYAIGSRRADRLRAAVRTTTELRESA